MDVIYVALYDLNTPREEVLSFKNKDRFIPLSSVGGIPKWCYCVDFRGNVGLIPESYIRPEKTAREELVDCIDIALTELERQHCGSYNKLQRLAIQELSTRRTLLLSPAHTPDGCQSQASILESISYAQKNVSVNQGASSHSNDIKVANHAVASKEAKEETKRKNSIKENVKMNIQEPIMEEKPVIQEKETTETSTQTANSSIEASSQIDLAKLSVPLLLIPSLIENVRQETQLSHANSKVATAVVLDTLREALPDLSTLWVQLRNNLNQFEIIQKEVEVIESEDRRKLHNIFKQLWYCKNDEQQRSWPVHEDEQLISSLLEELDAILTDADPRISREVVQHDDYEMVNLLVTYYQMEPRRTLRINMLDVFITLCKLDVNVISQLMTSVLPMELARDMQCTFSDTKKLNLSAVLLTIIFSTGQKPPNIIYEYMNKDFFNFLLENFEESQDSEETESVADNLLNIILAFNLHFPDEQNIIFQTLKEREYARMLPQKLILLVNREKDPTQIINHISDVPNTVLKFMVDFFANAELVDFFYLNDIKVLLDIIIRQLTDFVPGEPKRIWYLRLVKNLLTNLEKQEVDSHHQESLMKCFRIILAQEIPCETEIELVEEIFDLCPELFSSLHSK